MKKKKPSKKVTVDIEKFLDATGFIFQLTKVSVLKFDFSCIFEKDFTLAQKKSLDKTDGYRGLPKILQAMISLHQYYEKEYGVKLRKDIVVTRGDNFQWGAKVIKPKEISAKN